MGTIKGGLLVFANFNDAFKGKPLSERKVSKVMLDYLSNELPNGVKYISDAHGNLIMVSENTSMKLGGFRLIITDEIKKALGENCTQNAIMQYAYNAQKEIPLELEKDGFIEVNGEEVAIEKIHKNLFRPVKYTNCKWYVKPQDFPPPFEITISGNEYTRKMRVHRVPHESLNVYAFESEITAPLIIKFYMDIENGKLHLTISYDLRYAVTVRDMVESIFIYNAFVDGKGKFINSDVTIPSIDSEKKFSEQSAEFWRKVLLIEEKLQLKFVPPEGDVEFATMLEVEKLYQNLIKHQAIKENQIVNSITANLNMVEGKEIVDSIGKDMYFQYIADLKFSLFGEKFSLPAILGIFNCHILSIEKNKKKTKLIFADETNGKKAYTSVLCFANDTEMENFQKTVNENYMNVLIDAKFPQEYLNIF